MMMKKTLALATLVLLWLVSVSGNAMAADESKVRVFLEGESAFYHGQLSNGVTLVNLYSLADSLGADLRRETDDSNISLSLGERTVSFATGKNMITCNGQERLISVVPQVVGDELCVPLREIAENLGYRVSWDGETRTVRLFRKTENPISITAVKEKSEDPGLSLLIQYPQISGLDGQEAQEKINSLFKKHAGEFKDFYLQDYKTNGQETQSIHEFQYYIGAGYTITYNSKGLLNVVFTDYVYSGGAHGMTFQKSYLVDLKTGEEYELEDLFTDISASVSYINKEVRRQMEERELYLLTPFESIQQAQDFYLSDGGLVIFFQLYEYTPYALGFPEFEMSFADLAGMLNREL